MSRDEGPDTDEPVGLIEDGALFYRVMRAICSSSQWNL
jgi:hypothetical protein